MGKPLAGVKILDLTANLSGPYATMLLADQGAVVIKVESPEGDVLRQIGTGRDGVSAFFANANRNKNSIVLNLQARAGREVLCRLAAEADVVIQNFRPGVVERLGIGPAELRSEHTGLIYVSISGFGSSGPLANTPAYDHVVQAMTGFAAIQQAADDNAPLLVRQGVVDKATAILAAQAITAALYRRQQCEEGAEITLSMLDAALYFLWPDGMMNHTCLDPVPGGTAIAESFKVTATADGFVSFVTVTKKQLAGLLAALNLTADSGARKSDGGAGRMREARRAIGALLTTEVVERLRSRDVPCSPVLSLDDVPHFGQVRASGCLEEWAHPVLGRVRQPRPPAIFDGVKAQMPKPAPQLGEDTVQILTDAGFSEAEINGLREQQAIM